MGNITDPAKPKNFKNFCFLISFFCCLMVSSFKTISLSLLEIISSKLVTISLQLEFCKFNFSIIPSLRVIFSVFKLSLSTYIFNNSHYSYRPLWTHTVEAMGSRILLCFYSTNCSSMRWKNKPGSVIYPGYKLMNWSHYLVWDKYQKKFIQELVGVNPLVKSVGIIPFLDSEKKIPELPSNAIAVFDVTVFRSTFLAKLGIIVPYYDVRTLSSYLYGALEAITKANKVMVLKRKRRDTYYADKRYVRIINELSSYENVIILDPSINAERLIPEVEGVISIPYTSTSVVAKLTGIPSVFYDPTGTLSSSGSELHGVKMMNSKPDLQKWLKSLSEVKSSQ